ncbi:MAG: hypothetical protein IM571_10315 [Chitinophagaceae bacterium]|jgi:hypothetical protein|nr:hypothetical protein [Chitinophagaceae bacterium]MCA6470567.1 hypothetical protein [Chitinophagaceae bacterium]MCA6478330.1 hypothetical protein [Chitinophagaceae bacterium]MCA6479518.1 hypothetical protein [Chitinophagaceae bacterium]MCA6492072.1 hypothetical protein [Chitinophagaceae bacterium]
MIQLKIVRPKEWANRNFNYKILVNGKEQVEIANNEEKLLSVEPDSTIQAKLMWCGSKQVKLTNADNNIKQISISGNKNFNTILPIVSLTVLMIAVLVNNFFTDTTSKFILTGIIIVVMIYAVCSITIWRNNVLDIQKLSE